MYGRTSALVLSTSTVLDDVCNTYLQVVGDMIFPNACLYYYMYINYSLNMVTSRSFAI